MFINSNNIYINNINIIDDIKSKYRRNKHYKRL